MRVGRALSGCSSLVLFHAEGVGTQMEPSTFKAKDHKMQIEKDAYAHT